MKSFKNVIEPSSIALVFTVGALINRRRRFVRRAQEDESKNNELSVHSPRAQNPSESSPFHNNLSSRFLAYFPFILEIWYWNWIYWTYQLARALTAHLIHPNESVYALAQKHALSLLMLEHHLNIAIELPLQQTILHHMPHLMPLLAKIYHSHIIIGVLFITYTYTSLPRSTFSRIRRTLAANNLLAFLILSFYRCAPPRLLPPEYGYIDVLHRGQTAGMAPSWSHNSHQLTIAAMPSLHFGTSAFIAFCLWRFSPHRALKWLAPLWPAAMLLTILATANHFVVDAVVGVAVVVVGWKLNEALLLLRPVEDGLFRLLRTEKPEDGIGIGDSSLQADKSGEWMA